MGVLPEGVVRGWMVRGGGEKSWINKIRLLRPFYWILVWFFHLSASRGQIEV